MPETKKPIMTLLEAKQYFIDKAKKQASSSKPKPATVVKEDVIKEPKEEIIREKQAEENKVIPTHNKAESAPKKGRGRPPKNLSK